MPEHCRYNFDGMRHRRRLFMNKVAVLSQELSSGVGRLAAGIRNALSKWASGCRRRGEIRK